MTSIQEQEKLASIRKDICVQSEDTRESIKAIQEVFGPIGAYNMHNVSIMFNNKLSEILHQYYEVGLELFNGDHFLNGVVFNYIMDAYIECVNIMDNIIKYMKQRRYFYPVNDPTVKEWIKNYISISEGLYAFDIKNDLDKAIFAYTINHAQKGMIVDPSKAMEDMIPDLEKLGIDPEPLKDSFFTPQKVVNEIIKSLTKRPKKDIKE